MAEPTRSPALPSTSDAIPYVPVSWTAVAAVVTAGLFAALLFILGYFAFTNKKPLDMEELLVLPIAAVVLSFAARRMIRNSEGTRTGEQLADGAWWTALVLGLGYLAYLFAIGYSVRRDAANEVEQWVALVREEKTDEAFYKTLPPGGRPARDQLRSRYGNTEMVMFRTSDLMKLAQRNRGEGEFTFVATGVSNWENKSGTIDCGFTGTVTCPEGTFPVVIPLKGVEGITASEGGGGGRQWMIAWRSGNFIQQDKVELTGYGWLVAILEGQGGAFGKMFVDDLNFGPSGHPYLYRAFIAPVGDLSWRGVVRNPLMHFAFAVPLAVAHPGGYSEYLAYTENSFFKLPGGGEPDAGQKAKFLASWNALGLFEAGRRLKDPGGGVPDKETTFKITDTAVEVHVPVEIPLPGVGKVETARGKVVIACSDPALLAQIKERKSAAKGGEKPSANPPADLPLDKPFPWRVVRVESDLAPVNIQQQGGPGGPGGPGGGPPGGHGAGGHGG